MAFIYFTILGMLFGENKHPLTHPCHLSMLILDLKKKNANKFPPSRAGKGVKCPGYARGMLKLRFDRYIMIYNFQTYVLFLGPCPNVLVELSVLSDAVEGRNMLARTFTATVSTFVPEGRVGILRFTTNGDPPAEEDSPPTSVRPVTKGLIPGSPCIPFMYPPPGRIIWLTGRAGKFRRWRGGVGGLERA